MYRVCNILRWPLRFTQGYNRRPRIAAGYPIPLGFDAGNETLDILLNEKVDNAKNALIAILPEGIHVHSADLKEGRRPSIMDQTEELCYRFNFLETIDVHKARVRLEKLIEQQEIPVERKAKKGVTKTMDLKPFIKSWNINEKALTVSYKVINSQTGRPDEFLKLAFGENNPYFIGERKYATVKD